MSVPFHYASAIDGKGLSETLAKNPESLVLIDCEGYEQELFSELNPETARQAHFIVECHDFVDRTITERIKSFLSPSHRIEIIEEQGRDPNRFEELWGLSNSDRWQAMNELRPEKMHWVYAIPLG